MPPDPRPVFQSVELAQLTFDARACLSQAVQEATQLSLSCSVRPGAEDAHRLPLAFPDNLSHRGGKLGPQEQDPHRPTGVGVRRGGVVPYHPEVGRCRNAGRQRSVHEEEHIGGVWRGGNRRRRQQWTRVHTAGRQPENQLPQLLLTALAGTQHLDPAAGDSLRGFPDLIRRHSLGGEHVPQVWIENHQQVRGASASGGHENGPYQEGPDEATHHAPKGAST